MDLQRCLLPNEYIRQNISPINFHHVVVSPQFAEPISSLQAHYLFHQWPQPGDLLYKEKWSLIHAVQRSQWQVSKTLNALRDVELRILFTLKSKITLNYSQKPYNNVFEKILNPKMFLCDEPTVRELNRENISSIIFASRKDDDGNWVMTFTLL